MAKNSQSQKSKEAFLAAGGVIPTCSNEGCDKPVIVRDWKYHSFKHYCYDCNRRMKAGEEPREGVAFNKKNYCENRDGRLGFVCPVDVNFTFINSDLHSDHIDGDHFNNDPSNLQTLCSICHSRKGMASDDFNSRRKGRDLSSLTDVE